MNNIIPLDFLRELNLYLSISNYKIFQTCKAFYEIQPLKEIHLIIDTNKDYMSMPVHAYRVCLHVNFQNICLRDFYRQLKFMQWKEMKIDHSMCTVNMPLSLMRIECKTLIINDAQKWNLQFIYANKLKILTNNKTYHFTYIETKNGFEYDSMGNYCIHTNKLFIQNDKRMYDRYTRGFHRNSIFT